MNNKPKNLPPNTFIVDCTHIKKPTEFYTEKELIEFAELIIGETIKIIRATAAESEEIARTPEENVLHTVNNIECYFGIEK